MIGYVVGKLVGLNSEPPGIEIVLSEDSRVTLACPLDVVRQTAQHYGRSVQATLEDGHWRFSRIGTLPAEDRAKGAQDVLERELDFWHERLWNTAFDFVHAQELLGDVKVAAAPLAASLNARAADELAQVERLTLALQTLGDGA